VLNFSETKMSKQKNWLSNFKHEITTPINGIVGYSELLLEDIPSESNPLLSEKLEYIKKLGYELLALIKQDLVLDHIEENQCNEEYLIIIQNLNHKIQTPVNYALETCEKILLDAPSEINNDLQKIKQCINNFRSLIDNFLKNKLNQNIVINEGILSEKNQLSKDNILLHNYDPQETVINEQNHVLIVDDNVNNQDILTRHLQNQGYKVSIANNGFQAINLISSLNIDLILLDMIMPDITGDEVLKWIKNSQWRHLPVIMVSSLDKLENVIKCIEQGAEDYIHKPFNPILLKTKIGAFLEKKRLRDQETIYLQKLSQANQELRQKNELIRQIFGRYLSNEVVDELLQSPTALQLGGKRANLTILVSDVRGFTAIAETLEPEKVVKILNIYLQYMTDVIEKYNGTIDKFMGDGILVLFGIPTSKDDDVFRAIACGIEMQLAMEKVNEELKQMGLPSIAVGIGINTGEAIVGNIGSEKRTDYSVVGNHVNLAYRIESYTIGGQILISESTWEKTQSIVKISESQYIYPKGIQKALNIYSVVGIEGDYNLDLPLEKEPLVKIDSPIPLNYTLLEGKQINSHVFQGVLIELSPQKALIQSHQRRLDDLPIILNNIKINLLKTIGGGYGNDIYGKVLSVNQEKKQFLIYFTFKPTQFESQILQLYPFS
jgi:adenylate cyclase